MKKFFPLLLLVVSFFTSSQLYAQIVNSCFTLDIQTPAAESGETVCVDITTKNFEDVLGFQFSINWDPTDLRYSAIENLNLSGLELNDFGTTTDLTDNGIITLVWFDPSLLGQSLDDDAVLFSICYEVLAPNLNFAPISFSNTPTAYEFLAFNSDTNDDLFLSPSLLNGGVIAGPSPITPPPHIALGCAQNDNCMQVSNASIDITVEGGTLPFEYNWVGPNGFSSTNEDIFDVPEGWYTVTISDQTGLETTAEFQVGGISILASTATTNIVYCNEGDVGSIDLSVSGGSGDYSFNWSNGADTEDLDNLAPGDYSVTITDNENGCVREDSYTVESQDYLWSYSYVCNGNAAVISVIIWQGGEAPYTFEWSDGTIETADMFSSANVPGNGTYFVTVTDQSGCNSVIGPLSPDCATSSTDDFVVYGSHHTAEVDDIVCVDVKVQNFTDIVSTQFSINWNPWVAEFQGVQNFNLPDLQEFNFGISDENQVGILRFSWLDLSTVGHTVDDNTTIFQVCYKVNTIEEGTNISFTNTPIPIEITNSDFDLVPYNTLAGSINTVTIDPDPAIDLAISSEVAEPGDPVCVAVTANEFTQIGSASFNLDWDPDIIDYSSIQVGNLPNLDLSNFTTTNTNVGILTFSWDGQSFIDLPSNTTLFEICYTAIGELDEVSPVNFSNGEVVNDLDGNPVLFSHSDGSVSIQGFELTDLTFHFGEENVLPDEFVCVDVSVEHFNSVVAFQYPVHWDPSIIEFQGVQNFNLEGLNESNFGDIDAENGTLRVSWLESTGIEGVSIPDGTVIFEICFQAVGAPGTASDIYIDDDPIANESVFIGPDGDIIAGANHVTGSVNITQNFVWPGDADASGLVNHFDLLPIGLGFGTSGPTRDNATINWGAENSLDWLQNTPNSFINYKHLDTNGDGIINTADTTALLSNWGQTVDNFNEDPNNNFVDDLPESFNPLNNTIYVLPDTVGLGESVALDIIMGEEGNPVQNIYGIAFSIAYDTHAVVDESVFAEFNNSWIGDLDDNLLAVYRNNIDQGKIEIAITRTDQQNISGSGPIGTLNITIEDVIIRNNFYEMDIEVQDVRIINAQEEYKGITPRKTTSFIELSTGVTNPELDQKIQIYPNPTRSELHIQYKDLTAEQVQLFSIEGHKLATYYGVNSIPTNALPVGTYALRFITRQGVVSKRFVKID